MGALAEHDWWQLVVGAIAARNDHQLLSSPGVEPVDLPGVTGLLGARCFIYVNELLAPVRRIVEQVERAEPASFVLVAAGVPAPLDRALVAAGWSLRERLEMMILPPGAVIAAPRDDLGVAVEPIDDANLDEAQLLSAAAFGYPSDLSALVSSPLASGQLARDPGGRVLAIGGWSRAAEGARIINIATSPAHRGRGLGGLMTLHAVHDARRAGAQYAYLEATSEGAGVYRRVGFQTLDTWRVFHRPQLIQPATA